MTNNSESGFKYIVWSFSCARNTWGLNTQQRWDTMITSHKLKLDWSGLDSLGDKGTRSQSTELLH